MNDTHRSCGVALLTPLLVLLAACDSGFAAWSDETSAIDPDQAIQEFVDLESPEAWAYELSAAFRAAARRALPSVVYVDVERNTAPQPTTTTRQPIQTTGSGFIIDSAGHVLTNHHVIAGGDRVRVRLLDGREFDAVAVASDPASDVAVLSLWHARGTFQPVTWANSDSIRIGDWALALGNPLGLEFSVTAGIVGAMGRRLRPGTAALEAFIQTDAAINRGNSGGPLVDLRGYVIGINSAIASDDATFVGYGFAVPSNLARRVVQDLLEHGHVRRPRLGVRISDVSAVDAEIYELPTISGAEVNAVERGSPAAQAGIRMGDVIVALDDAEIRDATQLTARLAQYEPGNEVLLALYRDGIRRQIRARLGLLEPTPVENEAPSSAEAERLGFTVQALTDQMALEFRHRVSSGVVVSSVYPYSAAANAGLDRGHLLVSINGHRIHSLTDFRNATNGLRPGSAVSIVVRDPAVGETIINYRLRA